MMNITKAAISLLRVSTEGQAAEDRAALPSQRAANNRTAAQYGLEIVRTIEISDVSGAAVLRSPQMQELLRLIESREIHGVVAKEFSRLMRPENFSDYALLQAFADTGTILYLPEGPIDFRSKSGRLFGAIRAAIAGLERTEILERVWAAKEEKRRAGKHPQSQITLPFGVGYEPKDQRWFYKPEVEKVREAFRSVLAGHTSYKEIARRVGIDAFNLRIILRNPTYTGWRTYTQRRDPSPSAVRTKSDGRQADRPKIPRKPDEVIRVKVLEPLISEADFRQTQKILDLKKLNHWRVRPEYEHRFTYHGLLRCGVCGNCIYTAARLRNGSPRDWYVCKNRRIKDATVSCTNPYMRRDRLESSLDLLFAERLTEPDFLERIGTEYAQRSRSEGSQEQITRLRQQRERLNLKQQRVLEAYFDGLIDRTEKENRVSEISADIRRCEDLLRSAQPAAHDVTAEDLAKAFAPLFEWEFLSRLDKRRLLEAIVPEIHVRDYRVVGLCLLADTIDRNEVSRTDTGSWRQRA